MEIGFKHQINYFYALNLSLLSFSKCFKKTIFMGKGKNTFMLIKPYAVKQGHIGPILSRINEAGFSVVALRMVHINLEQAEAFYGVHRGQPFFERLTRFMSASPVVAAILEKENAVEDFRKLIGSTDPEQAAEGTIRKLFGSSVVENGVHGSDSDASALRESNFFFNEMDRF